MKQRFSSAVFAAALFGLVGSTQIARAGDIAVEHAWARATPAGAHVGAAYLTVKNAGASADHLLSVSLEVSGHADIHEMSVTDGVMTMRVVKSLEIPAGGSVELKPGSYHIMLMELKEPLKGGETLKGSLTFEKAGVVTVEYKIEAIGGQPTPTEPHHPSE